MIMPKDQGVPIGSIGAGKIDFFPDLSIGNATIMNNWSNPLRIIRGFHIIDLSTGTFLQQNPFKNSEVKATTKTPTEIVAKAIFPEVFYETSNPDFSIHIYSPFVPGNLRDSSLPAIIIEVRGKGAVAISFPNIVGSRRWGRANTRVRGTVNGVLMRNLRAAQSDPRYGEIFLGCHECNTYASYRYWVPASTEGMMENLDVFSMDALSNNEDEIYYIKPFAREEIGGIVWKEINESEKFFLTWFFNGRPHNYLYGHYYENWFKSAIDVAEYVYRRNPGVELNGSEDWLNDAYRNSLYVLTNSWLTKDGRLAIYEDPEISLLMNTIGSMTWDSISFPLLKYFPETVKKMDEYFSIYLNNGEIPHDLGEESIEDPIYGASYPYSWNDLGPTWILMIYRDYKYTNDESFLKRNYEAMKSTIDWLLARDFDGDNIPDSQGGFDNSYDGTYMYGASSYVGSLFMCALRAFIDASNKLGIDASNYEEKLAKARSTFMSLWNGRYFISWRSNNQEKNSCLSSQLLGEFWCDILGLGNNIDEELIIKSLRSIYELNGKASKYCLVNSVNPDGSIDTSTDQMKSCWPRISFAVAAHMILKGLVKEGLEVAKKEWNTIAARYPWNQPSKIDAYNGSHFGLPYYIGSASIYFVNHVINNK